VGGILVQLIGIYIDIVILDVILSWVTMAFPRRGFIYTLDRFVDKLVEPALYPIRRALRPYMRDVPLDLSPMALIFALYILQAIVLRVFTPAPNIIQ
jgi:YggT family protein